MNKIDAKAFDGQRVVAIAAGEGAQPALTAAAGLSWGYASSWAMPRAKWYDAQKIEALAGKRCRHLRKSRKCLARTADGTVYSWGIWHASSTDSNYYPKEIEGWSFGAN